MRISNYTQAELRLVPNVVFEVITKNKGVVFLVGHKKGGTIVIVPSVPHSLSGLFVQIFDFNFGKNRNDNILLRLFFFHDFNLVFVNNVPSMPKCTVRTAIIHKTPCFFLRYLDIPIRFHPTRFFMKNLKNLKL